MFHLVGDSCLARTSILSPQYYWGNEVFLFFSRWIRDIETSLRKSEERFQLAMKASHDGLFDWNLETNDIYYSPAWKRMLGYEDHELPNDFSIWENTTDPADVKKSWDLQQKVISKQIDRFVMEFKMKHKDGHWVDILSRAEAIFNDNGKAIRMIGTHTDITARKQAEESLRQAGEILKAMQMGLCVYELENPADDSSLRMVVANAASGKLSGVSPEEIIGKCIDEIFPALRALGIPKRFADIVRTGKTNEFEDFYYADDRVLEAAYAVKAFPLPHHRVGITFDNITESKQAEHQLKQQKTQLEQRNRALRQFNYAVSHELKTPLVSIESSLGLIQSILPQATDPELTRVFGYARTAARQMNNLLESLLLMFRVDAADSVTEATAFGVLVQDAIDQLTRENRLKGIHVTISAEGPELCGDRHKLVQIWLQLIENAAKYMGGQKDPAIAIGFEQTDQEVLFYVRDNGMGIEQQYQGKIFGLFDRLDKNPDGTGMGLALVQRVVDYYGGTIRVESEGLGKGSCFYFTLPDVLIKKGTTT